MNQVYWLDPLKPGELLGELLRLLAQGSRVAVEGDGEALSRLRLDKLPGAVTGLAAPFRQEDGPDSTMVVLPLNNEAQAQVLHEKLAPGNRLASEIGAVQIESRGDVQFLAGDGFHRECVSVGSLISAEFLKGLIRRGIIAGFRTPAEADKVFRNQPEN